MTQAGCGESGVSCDGTGRERLEVLRPAKDLARFPRLLLLDPTAMGSTTATGQYKATLFEGWPSDSLMQVTSAGQHTIRLIRGAAQKVVPSQNWQRIIDACKSFNPEVIYCRPDDFALEHLKMSVRILNALDSAAVLHIMDDWHGMRQRENVAHFQWLDLLVRYLMKRCVLRFTDGPAYIDEYAQRFGVPFENLLNGVDVNFWEKARASAGRSQTFTLTHMGNLEPTMSRQAVLDIAAAVETLAEEIDIRLEVYVRDFMHETARALLAPYKATRAKLQHASYEAYARTLCNSDVNLYAYNADSESVQYIGKGIPNKTCEVLAAGRPVLAYGSDELACIRYMRDNGLAHIVAQRSHALLRDTIRALWKARAEPDPHVAHALHFVALNHNKSTIRAHFYRQLNELAASPPVQRWPGSSGRDALYRIPDIMLERAVSSEGLSPLTPVQASDSPNRFRRLSRIGRRFTVHLVTEWTRSAAAAALLLLAIAGASAAALGFSRALPWSPAAWHLVAIAGILGSGYCALAFLRWTLRYRDQISARLAASPVAKAMVEGVLDFVGTRRRLVRAILGASGLVFGTGAVAAILLGAGSGPLAPVPWTVLGLGLIVAALLFVALLAAAALKGYAHAVGAQARAEVEDQIWQLEEQRAKDIEARFAGLQRDIADFEQRIAGLAYGPNRSSFQRFSRYLSMRQCDQLAMTWGPALGAELKPSQIAYFAHHIDRVEHNSIGRLATDIEAAVIRALVVWSVRSRSADVLEIGTLFGVGVAAIHDICRFRFDDLHFTVIDPLNGYYQAGAMDILLNMPISLEVFEANMARAGLAPSDFTVIRGLSEDRAVIEKAAERRYDVLIIDGDHSLLGVQRDFENYAPLVKADGYIIFDDYGVSEWPDIQAFVDNEVKPRRDLRFVGAGSRTAVFRVLSQVPCLKGERDVRTGAKVLAEPHKPQRDAR